MENDGNNIHDSVEGPWLMKRGLVSLWDMLKYHAEKYQRMSATLQYFHEPRSLAWLEKRDQMVPRLREIEENRFSEIFYQSSKYFDEIGCKVSSRLAHEIGNFIGIAKSHDEIKGKVTSLEEAIHSEMSQHLFVWIEPDLSRYFDQEKLFGEEVYNAFEDMRTDIKEAGNCLSFELYTASVFHLMRPVETGLRLLAKKLKAKPFLHPIDHADWHQLIEVIDKKLKSCRQLKRSKRKDALLDFYAGCLREMDGFKEIRNPVSHSNTAYTKHKALDIMESSKRFLQKLATKLKQKP